MNILHLTFDMRIGGTEMVIKNIIESDAARAFTMSVFCIEEPIGPWGEMLRKNTINVASHARQPGFDKALIGVLRKHIRENNIDILHCHQYTPWVYGTLAALGTNCKVLFTEHGRFYPDSSSWKRRLINPVLAFFTDGFTAISQATRHALDHYEFIPLNRIELIYNGIKSLTSSNTKQPLRCELQIPEDHFVLGTIARFDPIKNHVMMLDAFAKVLEHRPNCSLLMVGDGDERHTIEKKIADLGLSNNVVLTGYQVDPTQYLQLMDVFLLSSLSEGTSMTLLEAMSLSKPCVVTDAGGNPEIIKHEVNGYVTINDDASSFANAIDNILDNDTLALFGKNARLRFLEQFTDTIMVEKYTKMYESING
jgi:glycosyltransferase involved in cell wall biosynthesis